MTIFNFCNNFTYYKGTGILFETALNKKQNCLKNLSTDFGKNLWLTEKNCPFFDETENFLDMRLKVLSPSLAKWLSVRL